MKKLITTTSSLLLITCLIYFFLILQGCSYFDSGKDWTSWRGPYGNGSTDEKNWNPLALNDSTNILWRINIGVGHGAPAVKRNKVFVFGNKELISENDTAQHDIIYCLDSKTGEQIWEFSYRANAGEWPGPFSSPVINDEKIYTISKHGHIHCLNINTGEKIWKAHLKDFDFKKPGSGFACSPVFHGNTMLIKAGETGIALNKETGEMIWSGARKRALSYSSPVLFKINNQMVSAISNGDSLKVINLENGELVFTHPWGDSGNDPMILDNYILLANYNDGAALIDISAIPPQLVWETDSAKTLFQGYVSFEDHIYGYNQNSFVCLNIKTGETVWEEKLGQWGSMCLANDKLIIARGNGELIVANATPEGYQPISQARVLNLDDKSQRNVCWTMPILSHGQIYVRSNKGELVCVNVKS